MEAIPHRQQHEAANPETPLYPALEPIPQPGSSPQPPPPDNVARLAPRRHRMRVLGTWVDVMDGREVLRLLASGSRRRPRHLCYVNAHSLNLAFRDNDYRRALWRANLVLNDGIGLDLAARMRGRRFPENLNGSDFTLRLVELAADKGWRVYLYGGQPGVAATAAERLCETVPGLQIAGVADGYSDAPEEIVKDIRASDADVVIVALGQPRQELWLDAHLSETGCHLGVGVGAFLDFVSGRVVRAPRWMNRLGVEWLFRLVQEPGRLWRRYVVGNPVFLWRAWRLRTGESD
jgi:N-acetylglucosaminyldiphosphoundecaprenol N-acetyl-beta-D-mannosaminyltransferase